MQMQKRATGWCCPALPLPTLGNTIGEKFERAPDIGIAHHMLSVDLLTALEFNTDGSISLQQHPPDPAAQAQFTAMGFQASHQSHDDSLAATFGEIQAGIGLKPLAKQGCHCRSIGALHGQTTDQKAEQINPMAQKRITEVLIHQGAEGTAEMAHGSQVRQQLPASPQQLGHHIGARAQS